MEIGNDYTGIIHSASTSGGHVRKMMERSPENDTINSDNNEDVTLTRKKRKTSTETKLYAANTTAPGFRQEIALKHGKKARAIGVKLSEILVSEAGKKKISQATLKDFQTVKDEYQDLVDELILENALLLGRLWEARAAEEAKEMEINQKRANIKSISATTQLINADRNLDDDMNNTQVSKNRRRKNALKHKKQVRIQQDQVEGIAEEEATTDYNTDGDFTVVRKKRKKNKKTTNVTSDVTSGGETDASSNRRTQKQARINKINELKNTEPQKVFTVEVKNNDVDVTRKNIWADIVKKTGAPKIARSAVTQKGESTIINIIPADNDTYQALKSITEERPDVQLKPSKWPMVMIYDVDKDLTPDEISHNVIAQNTSLGNVLPERATVLLKPLFKRGPRDRETVWWVCEVRPDIHAKLLIAGRIYIGMSNCRVAEYFDFQQCFTCLKYGHREIFCKETTMTCTHCGNKGHKDTACNKKEEPPKCANCGGKHVAHSKLCRERRKAIDNAVRRTDYKDPTCQD
ncbi:Uncharacterized protein FWK35_00036689 [Aphis craccivora]|uniref:CCHC-type domain-containing protein n=1 Tax=Aphis craccivora TaxID=307492 RepID=A0A6G0VYJ0_APHCR|nr:Uncharacterized protein FWK35_00036689 [Aphis craccivora]